MSRHLYTLPLPTTQISRNALSTTHAVMEDAETQRVATSVSVRADTKWIPKPKLASVSPHHTPYILHHVLHTNCNSPTQQCIITSCRPFFLDVNECERGLDLCQGRAQCRDTDGDYKCTCPQGFRESTDELSCIGKHSNTNIMRAIKPIT